MVLGFLFSILETLNRIIGIRAVGSNHALSAENWVCATMDATIPMVENGESNTPPSCAFFRKIEFPTFYGAHTSDFVVKLERYFTLCKVAHDQKVHLAALCMEGTASTWFNSYMCATKNLNWDSFVHDLCTRFPDQVPNLLERLAGPVDVLEDCCARG